MQTFTISINNDSALKTLQELEQKHLINIIDHEDTDTPAQPGKEMSITQFKKWISDADKDPVVSFEDAKTIWAGKKALIQKNIQ